MHPDRVRRTAELAALGDRGEWEELYRRLVLWEFPHEARMGWQLAFLRPFAVPRMASTLVAAGHLVHNPLKRAYDTGLIIHEIVYGGLSSPRGREMVAVMNRAHKGHRIADADMTYVLAAFIVIPLRYIEQAGWRHLTDQEKTSSVEFYAAMGALMNIRQIPADYAEAESILDVYEQHHVRASQDGKILGEKLLTVLKGRLPGIAKPVASPLFTTQLRDPRIAHALGLKPPSRILQHIADGIVHVHALIQRQTKPLTKPIFTPGQKAGTIYPDGYQLHELGPDTPPAPATKYEVR